MSGSQMVCIKRPEPCISSVFEEMYLNERLVDVTLSCMDGQLQAHKLVLAASSQYFSGLFEKLANPFHYPVIVMKDMLIEDLKMLVEFMYKGELNISQDRLQSLMKSAENLQITGLSDVECQSSPERSSVNGHLDAITYSNGYTNDTRSTNSQRIMRKGKRMSTSAASQQQSPYIRPSYHQSNQDDVNISSLGPEKLLEQSMITAESLDGSNLGSNFNVYQTHNDATQARNLINPHQSSVHQIQQQLSSLDQQHHHPNQQLQLQVLSHGGHLTQQSIRNRLYHCNICLKAFREKANLKRHMQVHSADRKLYTCRECNRRFSWKDNWIRHTKTAHHITNVRLQA